VSVTCDDKLTQVTTNVADPHTTEITCSFYILMFDIHTPCHHFQCLHSCNICIVSFWSMLCTIQSTIFNSSNFQVH